MDEINDLKTKQIVEALMYLQGEDGVTPQQIKDVLELDAIAKAREILKNFKQEFNQTNQRGIYVVEFNQTYKFATIEDVKDSISKLVTIIKKQRLSNAAVETAGIIAYKQPITRSQIAEIRGVNSDSIVISLLAKGIIEEVGVASTPGNPILYGITNKFFDYFRLNSLKELPKLFEFENFTNEENIDENFDIFSSQREDEF
ncbi:SMC-Scp complex subunit ScpB [Candidatus Mycoplasma pogonae]